MHWPTPSQTRADGIDFTNTDGPVSHTPSELIEPSGNCMSAFVDALFGDMPVINEPYRPVVPDKWAASDGAFDLRDASVPIKVHPSPNMSTPP